MYNNWILFDSNSKIPKWCHVIQVANSNSVHLPRLYAKYRWNYQEQFLWIWKTYEETDNSFQYRLKKERGIANTATNDLETVAKGASDV